MKTLTGLVLAAFLAAASPARAASVSVDTYGNLEVVEKTVQFTAADCFPGLYAGMPVTSREWVSFIRLPADRSFEQLALGSSYTPARSTTYGNCHVDFLVSNSGTVDFGAGLGTGLNIRCHVSPIAGYTGPLTIDTARTCLMKGYDMLGLAATPIRFPVMRSEH